MRSAAILRHPRAVVAVALGVSGVGCARQSAPPGGQEDRRPPVVISTYPESFATLDDPTATIRFDFDERISERSSSGSMDDAVTISPRVGEIRVSHGRRSLQISAEEPFRPDLVYRVTLDPVVSDLFGNQLTDAFELVFSTGGEIVPTTLAGEIWGRSSGRAVAGALVHAVGSDSLVHVALSSPDGIYAFRYLPAGTFRVDAFEDVNRDGVLDTTEVQGFVPTSVAAGDTVFLDVAVLAPDTLPAVLMRAETLDSATVVVEFDDFLDPAWGPDTGALALSLEEGEAPLVSALYQEADYLALLETVADSFAVLDSIEAANAPPPVLAVDSLGPDSLPAGAVPAPDSGVAAIPPDSVTAGDLPPDTFVAGRVPAEPVRPGRRGPPQLDALGGARPGPVEGTDRVLPGRRLVAILDGPLTADVVYDVQAAGAVNINGLTGGGGETTVLLPAPPPDTIAIDTLEVDTLTLPDTGRAFGGDGRLAPLFRRR